MKSYIEQVANAFREGDIKKGLEIEKEGAQNITRALADVIETIPRKDLPIVIVALRYLEQILERQAGEEGTKIAIRMMQHLTCVDLSELEK